MEDADEVAMEMVRQGWQLEDGKYWHEPGDKKVSCIDLQPIIKAITASLTREAANNPTPKERMK